VETLIREGMKRDPDPFIKRVGANMMASVEQFREWGKNQLEREHSNLRQGQHPSGLVYTYSPLAETLLEQLEVPRQDQGLKEVADLNRGLTEAVIESVRREAPAIDAAAIGEVMKGLMPSIAETVAVAVAQALDARKPEPAPPQSNERNRNNR
jgi:hypothetical protein